MSEDVETIEVEADNRSVEDARQEVIRQMMDQWADGKLTDAQDTFNGIMNVKADELVAGRKAEIAASIYNDPIGETDYENFEIEEPEEEQEEIEEPTEAEENEEV